MTDGRWRRTDGWMKEGIDGWLRGWLELHTGLFPHGCCRRPGLSLRGHGGRARPSLSGSPTVVLRGAVRRGAMAEPSFLKSPCFVADTTQVRERGLPGEILVHGGQSGPNKAHEPFPVRHAPAFPASSHRAPAIFSPPRHVLWGHPVPPGTHFPLDSTPSPFQTWLSSEVLPSLPTNCPF